MTRITQRICGRSTIRRWCLCEGNTDGARCTGDCGGRIAADDALRTGDRAETGLSAGAVGVTVVSGLARGIDTAAHNGALQAKGRTVAVIGCGIDIVYPSENKKLADEIVRRVGGGDGISVRRAARPPEFSDAESHHQRLVLGVVVVEANLKSGALITANQAGERGDRCLRSGAGRFNIVQGGKQINQGRCKIDRGCRGYSR